MSPEPNSPIQLDYAQVCHLGLVRAENQDAMRVAETPAGPLFVISDGVGGYAGGAEASRIVTTEAATHAHLVPPDGDAMPALVEIVQKLNESVYARGQAGAPHLARMSATLVMALVRTVGPAEAEILNVGDSRGYLCRAERLEQISIDHTAAQVLVEAGNISAEEASTHPQASVLTRSMGQRPEVSPTTRRVLLEPQDLLLLCSDGLHGYVEDAAIRQVLVNRGLTVQAKTDALLKLALEAGGGDNITIQLISVVAVASPRTEIFTARDRLSARTRVQETSRHWSGLRTLAVAVAMAGLMAATMVIGYRWWQSRVPAATAPARIMPTGISSNPAVVPESKPLGTTEAAEPRPAATKPYRPPAQQAERSRAESAPSKAPRERSSAPANLPSAVNDDLDRIRNAGQRAGNKVRRKLPGGVEVQHTNDRPQP